MVLPENYLTVITPVTFTKMDVNLNFLSVPVKKWCL